MKKVKISLALIYSLKDSRQLKTLAFYLKLTSQFQNNIIYDYQHHVIKHRLCKILSVSRPTLDRIINNFIKLKIAEKQKKSSGGYNIRLCRMDSLKYIFGLPSKKFNVTLRIYKNSSAQNITDELILKMIEPELYKISLKQKSLESYKNSFKKKGLGSGRDSRVKRIDVKRQIHTYKNLNELDIMLQEFNYEYTCSHSLYPLIGYRELAKKLGYSNSYIWKVCKRLKEKGKLITETKSEHLFNVSLALSYKLRRDQDRLNLLKEGHGYVYIIGTRVIAVYGTQFTLIEYPLKDNKKHSICSN